MSWRPVGRPLPRPPRSQEEAAAARLEKAYEAWDSAITMIDEARKKQMQALGLAEPAKKALATLDREWDGIIAHREYPMVSLDNNIAERQIRGPVVTRKNADGSHNEDTARNAAVIFTVTATAQMADLNILTYLTAYLEECGRNGGKPLNGPALERFLSWIRPVSRPARASRSSATATARYMQASRHTALQRCQDLQWITWPESRPPPAWRAGDLLYFVSGHEGSADPALVRSLQQRPGQLWLGRTSPARAPRPARGALRRPRMPRAGPAPGRSACGHGMWRRSR